VGETRREENGRARACRAQGDRQKIAQACLSSRPRPNMASRSWAENC
jgi:hypothetical protein